jgi:hypothetical protein
MVLPLILGQGMNRYDIPQGIFLLCKELKEAQNMTLMVR